MTSTLTLPHPWDKTITGLLERPHKIRVWELPDNPERQLMNMWTLSQEVALHWLVKLEWLPRHRIPFRRPLTLDLKPEGQMLHALYRLCVETHALVGNQVDYTHAAQWFWCCFQERLKAGCWEIQNPGLNKEETLAALRSLTAIARDYQDPFEGIPGMVAHSDLLRLSGSLAERLEGFYFKSYRPFLQAWTAVHSAKDSSAFVRYFIEDGKLYRRVGNGKGKALVRL